MMPGDSTSATRVLSAVRGTIGLERQGSLILASRQKRLLFWLLLNLLVIQQHSLFDAGPLVDGFYQNTLNNGTNHLAYFPLFHCYGAFPIRMVEFDGASVDSCEALKPFVARQGKTLEVIPNQYNRSTVLLFYADLWLGQHPLNQLSMRPAMGLLFTLALGLVLYACYAAGHPLIGAVFVLLCASDPFQVFEAHGNPTNVFSLVITVGLLAFALVVLLLKLLRKPGRVRAACGVAIALGALFGVQFDMRLEGIGVFIGSAAVLLLYPRIAMRRRLPVLATYLLAAVLTNQLINTYFDRAFVQANQLVTSLGGRPAENVDTDYRTQWWAIWSGLGDYDQKYGFLVDDRAGVSYANSIVNNPDTFERTLERDVVSTIARDPSWFAGIIGRRLYAMLILNTPYRLSFGRGAFDLPVSPVVTTAGYLIALVFMLINRKFEFAFWSALLLSIPLVAIAQLGRYGLEFYSVLHLFVLAYVACWLVELVLVLRSARVTEQQPI